MQPTPKVLAGLLVYLALSGFDRVQQNPIAADHPHIPACTHAASKAGYQKCYAEIAKNRLGDSSLVLSLEDSNYGLAQRLASGQQSLKDLEKSLAQARAAFAKLRDIPRDDPNFMAYVNRSQLPRYVQRLQASRSELLETQEKLEQREAKRTALREADAELKQAYAGVDATFDAAIDQASAPALKQNQRQVDAFLQKQAGPMQESAQLIDTFNSLQRDYYNKLHGPIPLDEPLPTH